MAVIEFMADAVKIIGPRKSDNSFSVTLEVGEYQSQQIALLIALAIEKNLRVSITNE